MAYKFDCRTINQYFKTDINNKNGIKCPYLTAQEDGRITVVNKIHICQALRSIIWTDVENSNTVNEKIIGIKPFFTCPIMNKLRKLGLAPQVEMSIHNGKTIEDWNQQINEE